jgi:hypothetical protein
MWQQLIKQSANMWGDGGEGTDSNITTVKFVISKCLTFFRLI